MSETIQTEKEYSFTKEKCEMVLKGYVCSGCGGELIPIETTDNAGNPAFWGGCHVCGEFDWGCTPLVFEIAKSMVTELNYVHYTYDEMRKTKERFPEYWLRSQIKGTTSIVRQVLKLADKLQTPVKL